MDFELSNTMTWVIIVMAIWDLSWRGVALWRAAQRKQLGWFIPMLFITSVGVLPLLYLLTHSSKDD